MTNSAKIISILEEGKYANMSGFKYKDRIQQGGRYDHKQDVTFIAVDESGRFMTKNAYQAWNVQDVNDMKDVKITAIGRKPKILNEGGRVDVLECAKEVRSRDPNIEKLVGKTCKVLSLHDDESGISYDVSDGCWGARLPHWCVSLHHEEEKKMVLLMMFPEEMKKPNTDGLANLVLYLIEQKIINVEDLSI